MVGKAPPPGYRGSVILLSYFVVALSPYVDATCAANFASALSDAASSKRYKKFVDPR